MNKKHLAAAIATAILLAFSGVVAAGARAAASFEPALPLSPASQQNAARAAKEHLAVQAYSRKGLIDQLVYENYSTEDATDGVDSLNVDWNEQAAKSAKEHLAVQAYSAGGLVDQLVYEGFTSSQANYGVAAAGL
ncbi:prophage Lp1 protein 5 [Mycobacterium bohemicum DSM 44277]|uniref:Prophage Lp1 protein 5 n=1 Tax=Mycobacterium bohemicum DSM 44277 TaxID=1236609 RepID=A0A0U0WCR3_MYCBE|nr:Ltp family lipoprotein [Mycobacterium bohemicum]MCV6970316.1 Ltp family lipoprotein [Mycobacterium bohemicum]CPR12382.1 prophage Lp1 protein 5 [Mycobacterium bohemicum DSM 44277]